MRRLLVKDGGRWGMAAVLLVALAMGAACHSPAARQQPSEADGIQASDVVPSGTADSSFAQLVDQLSEPGGYFDTDNLISNETSYLHVLGKLRTMDVTGGAYLGVGPDQNFAYIAQIRPDIAFIIDIRRDNLLQHLFFKTLFAGARNRIEYLCLLFGKPVPDDVPRWDDAGIEDLVAYIDATPAQSEAAAAARAMVDERVGHMGLRLTEADKTTVERIHAAFIEAGLDLQFTSYGRSPRFYYPTYRDLILEKDLTGRYGTFLAREDDFRFLKEMEAKNAVVPVVGDLSGPHALAAIGHYLAEKGERVSAFYTSNVEYYLMQRGRFEAFAENVAQLPRTDNSVIIRSYFNRFSSTHPQTVPGYASTQLLQTLQSFVETYEHGGYTSYWNLITEHSLDLR